MKILAFDQSTKITGWSLFIDGEYVDSGVIDLSKNTNTEERSKKMGLAICKIIADNKPNAVIIEEVAMQSNAQTLKLLARIQGVAIGFCAAHDIELHILGPSKWRSSLGFTQGSKTKREQLKQQSRDFIKNVFDLNIKSEDENEAIAINEAAHRIYGWPDDDDDI
jgi:Holliday junction resolvasome RuvABC endonuclease subunit